MDSLEVAAVVAGDVSILELAPSAIIVTRSKVYVTEKGRPCFGVNNGRGFIGASRRPIGHVNIHAQHFLESLFKPINRVPRFLRFQMAK